MCLANDPVTEKKKLRHRKNPKQRNDKKKKLKKKKNIVIKNFGQEIKKKKKNVLRYITFVKNLCYYMLQT